jgi:hypothetical protein
VLQASTETETGFGGRDRVWSTAASLWATLTLSPPAQKRDGPGAAPVEAETARAEARDHPDAQAGMRLLVEGDPIPWRVRRVDRAAPGRMTLHLDRLV